MKRMLLLAPLATLLAAAPALAQPAPAQTNAARHDAGPANNSRNRNAGIPFANRNGVRDWRSVGDQTIYFQDNQRRWFRARLFAPSTDLPFANHLGIDTGPAGRLDRWSTVVIRGRRIPLSSFEAIEGNPPRNSRGSAAGRRVTPVPSHGPGSRR